MKAVSSIVPSAHQPALFFTQAGTSFAELVPWEVGGIFKIFSLTKYWIP